MDQRALRSRVCLATSFLLGLAGCAESAVDSVASETGPRFAAEEVLPLAVIDALADGGAPTVLVEIAEPEAVRGLPRADRNDRWRDQADQFLRRLPGAFVPGRVYENLPILELTIEDLAAAQGLADAVEVVGVDPDVAHEASLTQSLSLINQPTAEAAGYTGAGTSVAVLDTGADWTKSDLGSCTAVATPSTCRVAYAADFATSDGSRDDNGHGTNVSAIVARVAPGTDILALDVFRSDGYAYSTDIIAAIDWVITNQATYDIAAINMSLGSGGYTAPCTDAFSTSISSARAAGVSVAVASGNNGYTNKISSPACAADALSVGAVYDANQGGISWSTCSDSTTAADKVTCFSNTASFLDVLAPGALITAGGSTMGGTSQASPHVAGALAVLRGADPSASVDTIESRLVDSGTTVTDSRTGLSFPRIDLDAALDDCVSSVSVSSLTIPAAGSSGSIAVSTSSGCEWTVASDAAWLTLDTSGGTDSGTVDWTAAANTGGARSGTVTLSGRAIAASQSADTAPTGTVTIAGGASGTRSASVTLTLAASDSSGGVSTMCVSNSSSCTAWQSYATSLSWSLSSGSGAKTVYAWFRDAYGNTSSVTSDTITVDTTNPSNGTVRASGGNGQAALSWSGYSDGGSGISSYKVVQGTTSAPTACTSGTTVYSGSSTSATITGLTNGTTYGFRVCAVDGAGNTSSGATTTVVPAPEYTAPTGTISINAGASWTASTSTSVTLSATDASGVAYACLSNSSTCSTWFTMTSTKTWTLSSSSGTKTVYGWFKDIYGNVSTVTSDTIGLDATTPSNGTVSLSGRDGALDVTWTGYSDGGSGLASYKVMVGTSSPASSCGSGTTAYSGTSTSTAITGLTNGSTYTVRVCAYDTVGNVSSGATASLRVAPEYNPPSGTITVNGGASWATTTAATATLSATDDTAVAYVCLSTSTSCSSYTAYATSKSVTLSSSSGTQTVRAWFKDSYGNVTTTAATDTIGYDATKPSGGSLSGTAGAGQVALSWSGFTDTTSGVASYKVVYAAGTAPTSCSAGTVGYTGSDRAATVTGLTTGTSYGFRACAVDTAGNVSNGVTTSVTAG